MGGDTCATPGPLSIAISVLGDVPQGAMIRRAGAKSGDLVFVSGTIGDAGAGLALLKSGESGLLDTESRDALIARYRIPEPRLSLARTLRGLANAAADVSDGLLADLGHIAEVSGVGIAVDGPRIPLSSAYRAFRGADPAAWSSVAASGDDYEIVFTASPDRREAIADMSIQAGVPVAEIGRVTEGQGVRLLDAEGRVVGVPKAGYVHF
jgi:thiamine-monophosphate kinase